jgi:flotillin
MLAGESLVILIAIAVFALLVFITIIAAMSRYKRCPSDSILVIYGKVGHGKAAKCIHGGAAFVWPLIQDCRFLDLAPMTIDINLKNALSRQNIRVNVPSRFTIGISTEPSVMNLAAERLLSMDRQSVEDNAKDIIFGQLRATIATMDIEEINADRENFERKVMDNVETELKKIGLKLINVNITDITDESGYIDALGKKAASEATNQARVEVAEQERNGAAGEADAKREQRIRVARANATAVEGENQSKVSIAQSDADRREAEAEAKRRGEAAEKIKSAEALKASYEAEQKAEATRRELELATKEADIIVQAEIEKRQRIIQAEANKEQQIIQAEAAKEKASRDAQAEVILAEAEKTKSVLAGQAKGEAVQAEMEGQAAGIEATLQKQAEGFNQLIMAAGDNPELAVQLLIAQKLEELMQIQVQAIKGIEIDKITVWDSGPGANGQGSTANFVSGLMNSLPPIKELLNMSGMELPDWVGKTVSPQPEKPAKTPAAASRVDVE